MKPRFRSILASLLTLVAAVGSHSQTTVYWDGDGAGTQAGGAGTWDTSLARWSATSGGSTYAAWTSGNIAHFNGTAGTVTIGAPVTANGLTFATTGYTLAGSSTLTLSSTPTITTNSGVTATISAPLSSALPFTKTGAGTLVLGGTNSLGGITIDNGLVEFTSAANLGSGTITMNGGVNSSQLRYTTAGTLSVSNAFSLANTLNIIASTQAGSSLTVAGTISGTGGLSFTNSSATSTITLSGNNTYSGQTTFVSMGKVVMGHANAFGTGTLSFSNARLDAGGVARTVANPLSLGGALDLTGQFTFSGAATVGNVLVTNTSGTTFSGVLSGTGQLEAAGPSSISFTNTNTWTGGLKISGGSTVTFTNNANLGANSNQVIFQSGFLNRGSGGSMTLTHPFVVNGAGIFNDYGSGTITHTGGISGSGTLSVFSSDLLLASAGTFSGTLALQVGQLSLGHDSALGTGTLSLAPSGGSVTVSPSGGSRTLGNSVSVGGDVAFTAGTLTLTGATTLGATGIDLTTQTGADVTLASNIGQSASGYGFTKLGAGSLTLSGANTFSGAVALNAGTTKIGNSAGSAFGTGNVTVASGAVLGGAGSFTGALDLQGQVSPGNSPGVLSAGATTFAGGGSYLWEVNDATGAAGANWDLLSISGALAISATSANPFTVFLSSLTAGNAAGEVPNFDSAQNTFFTFVTTTGGITGFSADKFVVDATGFANAHTGTWAVALNGNNLQLAYTAAAIPEPSTCALLAGLGMLAFAAARRRHRA